MMARAKTEAEAETVAPSEAEAEAEQTPTFADRALARAQELEDRNARYSSQREEDLRRRVERIAARDFELDERPSVEIENGEAYFELDAVRMHYVGREYESRITAAGHIRHRSTGKRKQGPGFMYQEACAKCGEFSDVERVENLAELGAVLKADPEWECEKCNESSDEEIVSAHSELLRKSIARGRGRKRV